jgi:hypothetical protein
VYTDFAIDGVISSNSNSMVLADLPSKPGNPPTRQTLTDEHTIDIAISDSVIDNGSAIISYNIEIDNG